ncbi:hypothetical protein [Tritonibacter mobilis]|uniref:hypothetical protein n=1 Tax=Tritonibacter mobilis TaxID=379347 RepID=UPI000806F1C8|nr:hypothetical protein [Tritonibacter mobilis]
MNYPLLIKRVDAVRDLLWQSLDNSYKLIRWTPMLVLLRVWGESELPAAVFGWVLYYVLLFLIGAFLFSALFSHYLKDSPESFYNEGSGRVAIKIFVVLVNAGAAGIYLYYLMTLIGYFSDFIQDFGSK